MRSKKLLGNLLLSLISLTITFGVVELGARIYITRFAPKRLFDKYASIDQLNDRYGQTRHVADRFLGFIPTPNYVYGDNRHNSLGFRGEEVAIPKLEGTFRIVCLGGSTTYSASVEDYRESYPYQLQEYLREAGQNNIEVVNAGVFSYSSWESLVNLEFRVLDLDPDLIVIYHSVNDIDPRLVWPPEAYVGDASGYVERLGAFHPSIWERSSAVRMLLIYLGLAEPQISLWRNFLETSPTYYGGEFQNQKKDGTYPSKIFEKVSAMQMLETNKPVYFERNIRDLVAVAQANGVGVLLVTFAVSPYFDDNPRASSDEFLYAYDEQNEILRQIAASTGVYLYDFVQDMPIDVEFFSDGVHFTAGGNRLRASLIGEYLLGSGALQKSGLDGARD